MVTVIRAIVLAAIAQVAILSLLVGYLFIHSDTMSQMYAAMAERNSARYTDQVVHDQYNRLQIERSQEREDMRQFVDKRIDLKLSQAKERRQ